MLVVIKKPRETENFEAGKYMTSPQKSIKQVFILNHLNTIIT